MMIKTLNIRRRDWISDPGKKNKEEEKSEWKYKIMNNETKKTTFGDYNLFS